MELKTTLRSAQTIASRLDVKQLTDQGSFEGHASVFGVKDRQAEIVAAGAFSTSLKTHRETGTLPAMLWQHDADRPIGIYTEMREDETGLYVKGSLALDTQNGREAHSLLKMGALNLASPPRRCTIRL